MIGVRWGAATDTGKVRSRNEDAFLAEPPLFVVADGMGGHQDGAVASRIAVDTLRGLLDQPTVTPSEVPRLIQAANDAIRGQARVDPTRPGMGTTVVGMVLVTPKGRRPFWLAFNIGDSRLYQVHRDALSQISVDHSYVQELVLAGVIAPDEARFHPERAVITRALGSHEEAEADFWVFPATAGTRLLLCSDGLSGELDDAAITAALAAEPDPVLAAGLLVSRANEAGGRDNITVVVVDVCHQPSTGAQNADADSTDADSTDAVR
ncbi:MAG TPA: protein phosphatase 2C domain-containing protein [Kineosporiaceae bacterium]